MDNQNNYQNAPPPQPPPPQYPPPQYPPPQYPPPQYPPPQYPPPQHMHAGHRPGRGKAIAALILGIASIVFSYVPILGLAAGIIGLILALMSKKEGFIGGIRTAGFVCSIIGVVFGAFYSIFFFIAGAFIFAIFDNLHLFL